MNSGTADLRYPVGRFVMPGLVTAEERKEQIALIARLPESVRAAVEGLTDEQLDTAYRPEGWSIRQVVHHLADSHINSFIRFRLALTEDEPTIKPYDEARWAELADARMPVGVSLQLLEALHARWVVMLESMGDAEFARTLRHPEMGLFRLDQNLVLYGWHSRHHLAHITGLKSRMGWA